MEIMANVNTGIFDDEEKREQEMLKAKEAEKRLSNAISSVLGSKEGRLFTAWCLSFSALDASVSTSDSVNMAILSGRRDVGLNILNKLKAVAPEAVDLMYRELRNNG